MRDRTSETAFRLNHDNTCTRVSLTGSYGGSNAGSSASDYDNVVMRARNLALARVCGKGFVDRHFS